MRLCLKPSGFRVSLVFSVKLLFGVTFAAETNHAQDLLQSGSGSASSVQPVLGLSSLLFGAIAASHCSS